MEELNKGAHEREHCIEHILLDEREACGALALLDEAEALVHAEREQLFQILLAAVGKSDGQRAEPVVDPGPEAEVARVEVDHGAAADRGRTDVQQAVHLEDYAYGGRKVDALTVGQAEDLAVV